jgi:hypothetical protein
MVDILHNLLLWVSNVLSESKENGIHFSIWRLVIRTLSFMYTSVNTVHVSSFLNSWIEIYGRWEKIWILLHINPLKPIGKYMPHLLQQ